MHRYIAIVQIGHALWQTKRRLLYIIILSFQMRMRWLDAILVCMYEYIDIIILITAIMMMTMVMFE